ncbi:MAG: hypothetical protein HYV67_03585 [Candidatus Taylorbacteria bacterium]|nr:hypothetical protein [Candidatus Taylorbacteria bacterium]
MSSHTFPKKCGIAALSASGGPLMRMNTLRSLPVRVRTQAGAHGQFVTTERWNALFGRAQATPSGSGELLRATRGRSRTLSDGL